MPITKSAKKSLKVSETKRAQNRTQEILLSKALKKVSEKNVNEAISIIDKSAKIGIIHKNKAARLKSRIMKKYGSSKKEKVVAKVNVKAKMTNVKSNTKSKIKKTKAKTVSKKIVKKK